MKKKLIVLLGLILFALLGLLAWSLSPASGRSLESVGKETIKMLYPEEVLNQEVKVTIAKRESSNVITSKDAQFVQVDFVNGSDDTQEIRQFANMNASKFESDAWTAIKAKLAEDGMPSEGFSLEAGYDSELDRLKSMDIPSYVYIQLKKENSDKLVTQKGSILLVRRASDGKYLAIGVQYSTVEYNPSYTYTRKQGALTDLSQLEIAQGTLTPGSTCEYIETIYDEVHTPTDKFNCGNTELNWRFASPSLQYINPEVKRLGFNVLSKCSVGSLWQQFSCKYLGQ
jgi:hypothetical protein